MRADSVALPLQEAALGSGDLVLGVDVGGTKVAVGLVHCPTGRLVARTAFPTVRDRGGEGLFDAIEAAALDLAASAPTAPVALGIGVAELVDSQGNVTSDHQIPWRGLPVAARLGHIVPALVESDVRAAALAEALCGAGRAYRTFLYLTIGTGISHTLVVNGVPYAGARGNALVCANSPLTTTCPVCGATVAPIPEEFASGPGLVAAWNAQGAHVTRAEEVMGAAAKEATAAQLVQRAGYAVGVTLGFLINVLDPEAVIVGGGLGSAPGPYWESLVEAARAHVWAANSRDLPLLHAALGPDSGLIGAALGAWRRLQEGSAMARERGA